MSVGHQHSKDVTNNVIQSLTSIKPKSVLGYQGEFDYYIACSNYMTAMNREILEIRAEFEDLNVRSSPVQH